MRSGRSRTSRSVPGWLRQDAPAEVSDAIEELLGPRAEELKGRLARAVLVDLGEQPGTAEIVGDALDAVAAPDMLPIPLIIGAVLIYLARIKTKSRRPRRSTRRPALRRRARRSSGRTSRRSRS